MELIHPDRREELKNDLNQRFGISHIEKIKVGRIDSQKNAARLLVYFKDPDKNNFEDE
jgi:hypothetical protein